MLKGISATLSPQLLKVLCEMGHGDEIVLADGGFPAESIARGGIIIRADGVGIRQMLEAILPLFPLDQYEEDNFIIMDVEKSDNISPKIWKDLEKMLKENDPMAKITKLERNSFYERSRKAYAVVATSEMAQYGNVILKKGVCFRDKD